ncbi:hypothetical protein [Saccharopolyspora shandongensis]|nr:hypothetical protein [Saccharopolyspora shandongensis]
MLAAGQVPTAPDPGLTAVAWLSRCLIAGHPGAHTVKGKRIGNCGRCAHEATSRRSSVPNRLADARARARLTEPLADYRARGDWPRRCLGCGRLVSKRLRFSGNRPFSGGCDYCLAAIGAIRRRELPVDVALARALLRGQQPLEPWSGSTMGAWRMRCLMCGHAAPKTLSHLHQGVGICARCSRYGFDSASRAEVYVVTRTVDHAGKYGIGGLDNGIDRVGQHERAGWQLYERLEFDYGAQARLVEDLVEAELRVGWGVPAFLGPQQVPQGGWTETFDLRRCSAQAVWRLVERFAAQVTGSALLPAPAPANRRLASQREAWLEALRAGAVPLEEYPGGSGKPWRMRCLCCGKAAPRRLSHLREERTCSRCRGISRRTPTFRAHALARAGLVEPLAQILPTSAHQPWPGRCLGCGAQSKVRLANLSSGEGGCLPCGRTRSAAKMRLSQELSRIRFRARLLEPLQDYQNNTYRVRCRCLVCGHAALRTPAAVFTGNAGCSNCEKARLATRYRSPQDRAVATMHIGGWQPLVPYSNAKTPWPSRCLFCGTPERPQKTNVQQRVAGSACEGGNRHKPGRQRRPPT